MREQVDFLRKHSKCWRTICILLESVKPFLIYYALTLNQGIAKGESPSESFGNTRLVSLKMTSHMTSHNFQTLKIEIFSEP